MQIIDILKAVTVDCKGNEREFTVRPCLTLCRPIYGDMHSDDGCMTRKNSLPVYSEAIVRLTKVGTNAVIKNTTELKKSISKKKLIYLHGFGSSAASGTVQTLRKLLHDFEVVAPDIPVDPTEALPFLRGLCMNEVPDVVVGTSMGGMYAQQMRGYNRICVNPALEMSRKSKMLTVGMHEYFKQRKDGTTLFEITPEIISHYAEMEEHQFDGISEDDRKQVWGMFADNDQQVNDESLFLQYYSQVIHFRGEHRMDDNVIEEVLVPFIRSVVK